jgi:uncharacterized lipoprotein YmbA
MAQLFVINMQLTQTNKALPNAVKPAICEASAVQKTGPRNAPRRFFAVLLATFAVCALCGCALWSPRADPTRYYVLTVQAAPTVRGAEIQFKRWRVGLRPVEMPAYLRGKAMIVRTDANEIQFADYDRWAEPLDQGIGRVMRQVLALATNVEGVSSKFYGDEPLDCEVSIRILACEGALDEKGHSTIRFTAAWEARSLGNNFAFYKHGVFTAQPAAWNGRDYGQLAMRISEAIAGAGKEIASALPMEAGKSAETTPEQTKHEKQD